MAVTLRAALSYGVMREGLPGDGVATTLGLKGRQASSRRGSVVKCSSL